MSSINLEDIDNDDHDSDAIKSCFACLRSFNAATWLELDHGNDGQSQPGVDVRQCPCEQWLGVDLDVLQEASKSVDEERAARTSSTKAPASIQPIGRALIVVVDVLDALMVAAARLRDRLIGGAA